MKLNWKLLQLAILTVCTLSMTGCGGINAGGTVSPATFFLPGLMKNDAPAPPAGDPVQKVATAPSQQQPAQQLALAR